jgi:hypothetical protein
MTLLSFKTFPKSDANRRVRRHSRRTESAVFLIGNLVAVISMALIPLGIEII